MADGEDAQRLARKVLAVVLGRRGELELQSALAGVAKARATKIISGRSRCVFGRDRRVYRFIDPVGEAGRMVEIERQNGTSCDLAMRAISAP